MEQFEGKTAVVTGAASGMGLALAGRCVEAKMRVVLADVEAEPLKKAEEALLERGGDVLAVETDVRKLDSIEDLHAKAIDAYGKVHLLCNNAGVASGGALWEQSPEEWGWALGVNLWGFAHAVRTFIPGMIAHGEEGHVVNTCSVGALIPMPFAGAYGVAKAGVLALSETLFLELKVTGARIGVSVLCPGLVNTNIMDSSRNWPEDFGPRPSDKRDPAEVVAMREMMASAMSPDAVAEGVFNAIRADQLYVLTHPEYDSMIRERMDAILERRNPALPGM
jgi:NAD(P)-dependent dehydrogenase (short-subunit alcohol dehydrogenase family)